MRALSSRVVSRIFATLSLAAVASCAPDATTPASIAGPAEQQPAQTLFGPSNSVVSIPNLIDNPGLETASNGAPTNWSRQWSGSPTPTFTYPVSGRTGNAAMVTLGARSSGNARWQPNAESVYSLLPYSVSFWYKSTTASSVVAEYTGFLGFKSYNTLASLPSSNGAWKQYSTTFYVPLLQSRVSVYPAISAAGSLTIDDYVLVFGTELPTPAPAITIAANPATIARGQSSTITWSSTNATSCTASGGWSGSKGASGTQTVTPTATTTYTLSCSGSGGNATASTVITVGPATPTPTVSLVANPTSITAGAASTLTWSSTNATSCAASDAWTGTKGAAGSLAVTPAATSTYTLSCTGAGGTVSTSATVTVNAVVVVPPANFTEGLVSFSFDDSWDTQYNNALPILEAAGFKGTFYLTTTYIKDGYNLYMTPAMVLDITARGHEIAAHTLDHPDLATLTSAQVLTEITDSRNYLRTLTGKPVNGFAYPYGSYNASVQSQVQAIYTHARGTNYLELNTTQSPKFDLRSECVNTTETFANIQARIDAAKANKQWFILCFHRVQDTPGDDVTITPAFFSQIVAYVKQTGIKVVTVEQGRALMP